MDWAGASNNIGRGWKSNDQGGPECEPAQLVAGQPRAHFVKLGAGPDKGTHAAVAAMLPGLQHCHSKSPRHQSTRLVR